MKYMIVPHWFVTTSNTQGYSQQRKYIATQGKLIAERISARL